MPKRLGKADGGGTSAKACSDSSQGRATVQPAPRSTARRETGSANVLDSRDMVVHLNNGFGTAAGLHPGCAAVKMNRCPQRLKPRSIFTIYVRAEARTLQARKSIPQGLKPDIFAIIYGTAESRALIQNHKIALPTRFSRPSGTGPLLRSIPRTASWAKFKSPLPRISCGTWWR
jgi:hypothetical protein